MAFDWLKRLVHTPAAETEDDTAEVDPFDPFPEPIEVPLTDVFDLHTIQPREVKRVTEEYLEQAHAMGFKTVRIIHGKGIGVQRQIVHTILGRTPFVLDWKDAADLGATVVRLK